MTRFLLTLALATVCAAPGAHAQEKIKIGYWTSGFSVGFGAVLEAGKFVEQQGLVPEYVHFADVNGPTKAMLTQSIDVAFARVDDRAFTLGIQGAPIEIVLATQIAEATFVTKDGSPIKSIADLKGKKLGMSPVGSATYAIAAAVLERNFGLKPSTIRRWAATRRQLVSVPAARRHRRRGAARGDHRVGARPQAAGPRPPGRRMEEDDQVRRRSDPGRGDRAQEFLAATARGHGQVAARA